MTLEQVKAADPAKGFKSAVRRRSGPVDDDMFVEAVYKSLTAEET